MKNPKLDSTLSRLLRGENYDPRENIGRSVGNFQIRPTENSELRVVAELSDRTASLENLENIEVESRSGKLVQFRASLQDIKKISGREDVEYIRPPLYAHTPVESEGVGVIGADNLHEAGITGEGVKVAVIDAGFEGYSSNPEVPSSSVIEAKSFRADGDIGAGEVHGSACAEVILDVAPSAKLYLLNFGTGLEFADAVNYAISEGVDVISCSVCWFFGGYDGTGFLCEVVDNARDHGIFFAQSAGNYAKRHYEGSFEDTDHDNWHEFSTDPRDEVLNLGILPAYREIVLLLSWDDWPESDQDYDLYLLKMTDSGWKIAAGSENPQTGTQPPTESIVYTTSSQERWSVVINKWNATRDVHLELYSPGTNLSEHNVESSSLGIPADAEGATAAGATYWESDDLEDFSSRGPTNDGRTKPNVTAPDGVSNYVYGNFYGTSASAPHLAGTAALLLDADPTPSPDEVQILLESSAKDLGPSGEDNLYGSGRIDVSAKGYFENVFYVDNDWVGGSSVPSELSFGKNAFASIENAVEHADARENNRIEICPGTYGNQLEDFPILVDVENLTITSRGGAKLTVVKIENIERNVYEIRDDNARLRGFKVVGAENATGILISSSEGVRVENNILENNRNGVFLIGSSNNFVENNIAKYNTRKGIRLLDSSENNTIRNNLAVNNGYSGFYLAKSCTRNLLENNTAKNNWDGFSLRVSNGNTLRNSLAENNGVDGFRIMDSENNSVRKNLAVNNGYSGFLQDNCTGNLFENNVAWNNHNSGFSLRGSNRNILRNSLAENNGVDGFRIMDSDNNILSNNVAENNRYRGFHIHDNSCGNILDNNFAENNKWLGITVGGWVEVDENSQWGVINSHYNVIKNNGLENHSTAGISLYFTTNNVMKNNLVKNNHEGIHSRGSSNNQIYHNNFQSNTTQAFDNGSNTWDDGYPSGGNYWSFYTGSDNYSGENQNQPGSDGIGDTPYQISGDNNIDRYPLMGPWTPQPAVFREKVELKAGWNLFSLPLRPENATAENVFSGLGEFPTIYGWTETGYDLIEPQDNLEVGEGYWVYSPTSENLAVRGIPVEDFLLELSAGWNLAGIPSGVLPTTPASIFTEVPTVYGWTETGYDLVEPEENFEPAHGYWIHMTEPENISIP